VLPGCEFAFGKHAVHDCGPLASLYEPAGHAVHGSFEPKCPTSQTQAASVALPICEPEFAGHGSATEASSTPPDGVPRQKEPGGQAPHALLFHQ